MHYSDCLKLDFFILHPVVKVSLVNLATGKLISKSEKSRKVTSYYEGEHVSHIVQLMTQPYDFKRKKSIVPRWEELLLAKVLKNNSVVEYEGINIESTVVLVT